ncbi:hypothetical protein V9T40_007885 [Parthenolecanium corni]|uniref:Uncharacterized protein n=1 Tax=Parthenolecanium corni TaxID=536013 RepID=A0AAN9TKP4_9HEMI
MPKLQESKKPINTAMADQNEIHATRRCAGKTKEKEGPQKTERRKISNIQEFSLKASKPSGDAEYRLCHGHRTTNTFFCSSVTSHNLAFTYLFIHALLLLRLYFKGY